MVGFMGREEYEEVLGRQAVDDMRRKRLRKMLKSRKRNKGEERNSIVARSLLWSQSWFWCGCAVLPPHCPVAMYTTLPTDAT